MMHRSDPTQRLLGFAVVSVCLHGTLLLMNHTTTLRFAGNAETILSVSLDGGIEDARPESTATPPRHTTPAPRVSPRLGSPAYEPADSRPSSNVTIASTPPSRAIAGSAVGPAHGAHAQIQSQLLTELKRYFEYPLLARRRGWEGTVWLEFIVMPDGVLERIHVAQGSGYDALDDSALNALRRVGRLPEASAWLNGHALDVELPVIYRLQEP